MNLLTHPQEALGLCQRQNTFRIGGRERVVGLEANDTEELGGIDGFSSSDVSFDSIRRAADRIV